MRLLAFGAGAIGAYIGGSLARVGHEVIFVERPEVAAALEHSGLHILSPDAEAQPVPPNAYKIYPSLEAALSSGQFDLALFALKSFDTAAFIAGLPPKRLACPILCLSNGVDNEPALAAAVGEANVIAGTVTTAIGKRGPGEIVVEKRRGLGIASGHPLSPRLAEALNAAGLNARLYARAADMKWSKLLTNLLANASAAILNLSPAEIFAHPGLARLEMAQLREALDVMRAMRIEVVDLPRTPVRLLAWGARLPSAWARPLLARAVGGGRGGKMPSFHIDLYAGRGQSEVGFLNGAVARFGTQAGLPTPVNRFLTETLQALTRQALPRETFAGQPEKFLAQAARFQSGG